MKSSSFLLMLAGILMLGSCTEPFKKGPDSWEYKIFKDGKGTVAANGDFVQYELKQILHTTKKDSVLSDSRNEMSIIERFDSVSMPPISFKILSQLRPGDSAMMRIKADTLFKARPMPPMFKKGDMLYVTYKLTSVFKDIKQANEAYKTAQKAGLARFNVKQKEKFETDFAAASAQMQTDDKIIQDYFAKNNISGAVKTKWGTYVLIKEPGTGNNINDSVVAKVKYTGRNLDGTVFDSNMGAGGQPYPVYMNQFGGRVIMGWYDGLMQLKKGSKASFYIPSFLAYGKEGSGDKIKPNAVLTFDVEIADVTTLEEEEKKAEEQQRIMEEQQQRMADSVKAAQAKAAADSAAKKR